MKVSVLLKMLDDKYHYYYTGSLQEDVYGVQRVTRGEPSFPGVLYVTDEERNIIMTQGTCLIYFPENNVAEMTRKLQEYVIRDYQRRQWLAELAVMCAGKTELQQLCDVVYKVMGNPSCFLTPGFCVSAASPELSVAERFMLQRNIQKYKAELGAGDRFLAPDGMFPYPRMVLPVVQGSQLKGYLYCVASEQDFWPEIDREYFSNIGQLLSGQDVFRLCNEMLSEEERFLADLIEGRITDSGIIRQKTRHFGINESSNYYLLSVKAETSAQIKVIIEKVEKWLKCPGYRYKDYCVVLINKEFFSEKDCPELIADLKQSGLYAGISYPFSDLLTMPVAYMQSILATLLRGQLSSKVYLSFYGEIVGIHMYQILSTSGVDLLDFCDPAAVKIGEYDAEHGTMYLESLAAYLCLEGGMQKVADALSIHKNTLNKHIRVLEERFHIDFSNHRETTNLRRTMEIFSFLGKINIQKLLGNEQ